MTAQDINSNLRTEVSGDKNLRVLIGALTFRRPAELPTFLDSVSSITVPPSVSASLLIADNDPQASAQGVMDRYREKFPAHLPLIYERAGKSAIAAGRNFILEYALNNDYDILCFLDDDQEIVPEWLAAHASVYRKMNATYQVGPVEPVFPDGLSFDWGKTGLYNRRNLPTGTAVNWGNAGGVWIDLKWVKSHGIKFENFREGFTNTGGEDTLFFFDILRAGGKGIFVREAIAKECYPQSRLSWRWVLKRYFSVGVTLSLLEKTRHVPLIKRRLWKGLGVIPYSLLMLPVRLCRMGFREGLVYSLAWCCRGLGLIYGFMGGIYEEYKH